MRKYLLATLLGLGSLTGHAQTALPKGTWQLGGSINYGQQHNETSGSGANTTSTSNYFSANPTVGYLVADNLAVGIDAGYSLDKSQSTDAYNASSSGRTGKAIFGGLFADYYWLLGQYFGVKGRLGAGYSRSSYDYSYANSNGTDLTHSVGNSFSTNLVPSLLFFPCRS